jgi:glycosyltransferase involved in cell wall biosynthesis
VTSFAAAIPAYQAACTIGDLVRRTLPLLPVVVVDDGSDDGTGDQARSAGAEVRVLRTNSGKGAALREAFEFWFARGIDSVVTLDADGQHLPEEVPRLLAIAGEADLVLGARDHLFAGMSSVRRASNSLSSWAISRLAGCCLQDVQTGFRVYSRRLLETTGFPEQRFDAESAVVVRAARLGFRIVAVPVKLGFADGRTTSHYRPLVDSLRIGRAVVRARLETGA